MLTTFLNADNDNVSAMEAVSTMALMLGEDPIVACESDANAEGIAAKFKSRVSAVVTKIKELIQRVVGWIKTKFFALLKMNTSIDQKLWNDGQEILKLCDKAQGNLISKFINKLKTKSAIKKEDLESYMTLKAETEDAVDAVTKSEAYKLFKMGSYGGDNAKMINVRGSSLENQKSKFNESLSALQEQSKKVQGLLSSTEDNGLAKQIEMEIAAVNLGIKLMNIRMEVLNKFMSSSKNVPAEDKK